MQIRIRDKHPGSATLGTGLWLTYPIVKAGFIRVPVRQLSLHLQQSPYLRAALGFHPNLGTLRNKDKEQWERVNGDTHSETGGPARLPAKVAGRWEHINWNSVRWGKKFVVLGWLEQPDKSLLYRYDEPSEPTKEGPFSFVLFESPFTSVSTACREHHSLSPNS